ncbi:MAG TPA: EFR1 family ferrodoxin [Clostridia bacterium]|nr:EFR1 family ferrodoxin [Clostridia bacterium]
MDSENKRIKILHHSGAGSTQTIAEVFYQKLKDSFNCSLEGITLDYDFNKLEAYDFIIFACPTYHCQPSESMMDFLEKMPRFKDKKNIFFFITYGLFSGNTERIFIKACENKNVNIIGSSGYKAPATDGALLMPSWQFLFKYGKNISKKIKEDLKLIKEQINSEQFHSDYSIRFKLYTILNYPNKLLGKKFTFNLSMDNDRCIDCNRCVDECIRKAWINQKDGILWLSDNCESCFKCVHHCPKEAIILSKKTFDKPKLNGDFYSDLRDKILMDMNH